MEICLHYDNIVGGSECLLCQGKQRPTKELKTMVVERERGIIHQSLDGPLKTIVHVRGYVSDYNVTKKIVRVNFKGRLRAGVHDNFLAFKFI